MALRMTELEAVNQMLEATQLAPVNSLEDSGTIEVAMARRELEKVQKRTLSKGWAFNSEKQVSLPLDSNGHMIIPQTAITIDPSYSSINYVRKSDGGVDKLYDMDNHTFSLSSAPLLDIVWWYDFGYLPPILQSYIVAQASVGFQNKVLGDPKLDATLRQEAQECFVAFKQAEGEIGDYNMLTDSTDTNWVKFQREYIRGY